MYWLDRFRRDEQGSATIEFVLWVPIIVALLVIVIDAATIYVTHTEMWNVARDTARRMVVGALDANGAKAYAADAMRLRDYPYAVSTSYDENTGAEVVIVLRINDMSIMGYSPLTIVGGDMMARVFMRADPNGPVAGGGGGSGGGGGDGGPGGGGGGDGGPGSGGGGGGRP